MDRLLLNLIAIAAIAFSASADSKETLYKKTYPPCKSCKVFVDSFRKNQEAESPDKLCQDVAEGRDQCLGFADQHAEALSRWWSEEKGKDRPTDVFRHFCIEEVKLCCPENHYGPECVQCQGYPDDVCHNNGKCKGAGTRKGNGGCHCDGGYAGDRCDSCAPGYFEAYRDDSKLLCTRCHPACKGPCQGPGPKGCELCKPGWLHDEEKGCLDVNECTAPKPPCRIDQFCVNNDGSFSCLKCDPSCHSCTGDGPDMCKKCAAGFALQDGMCVDAERESRQRHMYVTRYLTYLGLCVATCIIFNKNTVLAAIIGIVVAVYISTSEYVLNTNPTPKTDGLPQRILNKIMS